jgi:hypothetical protein
MAQTKLPISRGMGSAGIAFSGEIALEQLPAGRYVLQISASVQESKKNISQQTDFTVE